MKILLTLVVKTATLLIVLASILPSIFPNIWVIDILSNFKIQIITISIVLLLINLFNKKSYSIGIVLLIITFWNCSFVYSLYYPSRFGEINKLRGTTITSINLLSSNNESDKVIKFIKANNPDILILLEYSPKWKKLLLEATSQYEYHKSEVRNDNFGIGYFSKIKAETSIIRFDNTGVPSIRADLKISEHPLTIIATHPFPPVGQQRFTERNNHLKNIAKKRKEFSQNLVVVGDLNTSSFSSHFTQLVKTANLKDSRNGFGVLPTWHASFTPIQTTLDHFLVSQNINVLRRGVSQNIGSDHLPIHMELIINN